MRLCFAGIGELLGGNDQPDGLVIFHELVLALSLLLDVSKECLDGLVSLQCSKITIKYCQLHILMWSIDAGCGFGSLKYCE